MTYTLFKHFDSLLTTLHRVVRVVAGHDKSTLSDAPTHIMRQSVEDQRLVVSLLASVFDNGQEMNCCSWEKFWIE